MADRFVAWNLPSSLRSHPGRERSECWYSLAKWVVRRTLWGRMSAFDDDGQPLVVSATWDDEQSLGPTCVQTRCGVAVVGRIRRFLCKNNTLKLWPLPTDAWRTEVFRVDRSGDGLETRPLLPENGHLSARQRGHCHKCKY